MKTSDLIGPALDWAVAKCEGYTNLRRNPHRFNPCLLMTSPDGANEQLADLDYSTDWAQGGPIIERECICLTSRGCLAGNPWEAVCGYDNSFDNYGPTPLIAAMRCFVFSRLGDEMEIPEELR